MTLRSASRSTLGWVFGLSLSVLFVSMWGRAVVTDTDTLARSIAPLAATERVVDFIADWMGDEMVDSGVPPEVVERAVPQFLDSPAVGRTVDGFAAEVVDAAASSDPAGSTIDMRALISPAIPEVSEGLRDAGYDISDRDVREVVEGFDPLVIREPGSPALVGPSSGTASRLGTAAVLAAIALLVFGAGFVRLSDDRIAAVRNLLNRVAVGGLSFAVFLRLSSWVVDPRGGRAPLPETISNLAGSKWLVPLRVAIVAAILAGTIYLARRLVTRVAARRLTNGSPTPSAEQQESLTRQG